MCVAVLSDILFFSPENVSAPGEKHKISLRTATDQINTKHIEEMMLTSASLTYLDAARHTLWND